jgi:O-antigen/teichoic acid export membrane protein
MNLITAWKLFLKKGNARTVKAKKNVLLAILARGAGILIGFAYFPISLAYLSPAKFGIFLTLTSMVDWFNEFDVGIGNGLRNKLGEAAADGDDELARGYVSTAYFFLGSLVAGITIAFMMANVFIPWSDWLQTDAALNWDIRVLAMFIIAAFAIRFVSSLVYQIFYALQRTAMVDFFQLLAKVLFLGIIIFLFYFTEESLVIFGAAKTLTFACTPLLVGIFFFNRGLKKFRPSFNRARRALLGDLFSLGLKFFVIKISMIVIYQTNNFLIAGLISVDRVAEYQAAYKYLSVFLIVFNIITAQLWAANIEAYRKGEIRWMKESMNGVLKIWMASLFIAAFMVIVSPIFYHIWLQDKIEVSMLLSGIIAFSICTTTWVNMFNLILNGTGKIRLQMYAWIVACVVNIPASIFFAKTLGLGLIGIEMGTIFSLIPLVIFSPLQVRKILRREDRGIWGR